MYYVYLHIFANGSHYIGKGTGRRAWSNGRKKSPKWWATYQKYGMPFVQIIKDGMTSQEALDFEIETIKKAREKGVNLCNLTDGGEGLRGYVASEETRQKMRILSTGRKKSPESIAKLKESLKGRIVSESTREKIRISNLTRDFKHTPEMISKMKLAKQGKKGALCPNSKKVFCSNGMVFDSTFEAQNWLRANGFEKAHAPRVASVCRHERKKAYKLVWSYCDFF